MSSLTILTGKTNKILRTRSKEIKKIDQKIKSLAKGMIIALDKAKGMGLAAPQAGENIRLILVKLNYGTDQGIQVFMINPEIIPLTDEKVWAEEGCLSLPGIYLKVERLKNIIIKFMDLKGESRSLQLKDINARIIQHEIDHLDGVLICDKGIKEEKTN